MDDFRSDDTVARLPSEYVPEKPVPSRPGRLHGLATIAMAASAVVGFAAMFAFITIGWPGKSGRFVIGVVFFAGVAFVASACIAVFAAARDTYPSRSLSKDDEPGN